MKILKLMLVVAVMLLVIPQAMAGTYIVDGNLSDWGISNTDLMYGLGDFNNKSYWVPNNNTVDWIVENDFDPRYTTYGISSPVYDNGVHILGNGSSYSDYLEPRAEPIGNNEKWDIEALYFDDNNTHAFFAIVTSNVTIIGDLRIVIDGVTYGIVLRDHGGLIKGQVYKNPSWLPSNDPQDPYIDPTNPGVYQGMAIVAVSPSGVYDHGLDNWIIEVGVDKSLIGYPSSGTPSSAKFTTSCVNDIIQLSFKFNYNIPEFLIVLIPAGIVIGSVYYFRRQRM